MNTFFKYIKLEGDKSIWVIVLLLILISLFVVYSATGGLAYTKHNGDTMHLIFKHFKSIIAGILFMYFAHKIPVKYYSRLGQLGFWLSIMILLFTLFFGASINDASRWIKIGDKTIQTFDIAKLSIIIFLVRQLIKYKTSLSDFKTVSIKVFVPLIAICSLIFPANFSTAAILFSSGLMIMFFGGVKLRHLIALTSSIIMLASLAILLAVNVPVVQELIPRSETWVNRVKNFTSDRDSELNRDDYHQVVQAKIALVNGGITGRGPGKSIQRNVLPHPYSDYVYAIIIEEYGIVGGVFVLILYLILMIRGKRIFDLAKDGFSALLGIGLSISLVFQALIHMAVNVDFFPVTGQTLPLVSMGSVSIFFTCLSIGVILSASKEVSISKIKA